MEYQFLTDDTKKQILEARALTYEADYFRADLDKQAREAIVPEADRADDPSLQEIAERLEGSEIAANQVKAALADYEA